ncbi:MAG TPA: serine hydrolase [Rhodanobacteraceae bacterium]|nr:serine hydrolase [Rhodanobacteraceae bacterium]
MKAAASIVVAVLMMAAGGRPAHAADDDALLGLWTSEVTFVSQPRGPLEVTRDGAGWRATLAGAEAKFAAAGDAIRFAFPGRGGAFRGKLAGGAIDGYWLQPSGASEDRSDPGGSGQPFATPLILKSAGRDAWRGEVHPLDDRFTLYLKIFRGDDGALVGAFRNPEVNSRGGASQFRVSRDGDRVHFGVKPDPSAPEIAHDAILRSPDRLEIPWPDLGRTLTLARRDPKDVPAFFPRPPGTPKYDYRKPPALDDGWTTANASDVGIDEAALAALVQRLIDADPAARRPSLIHSLLVAHRGKLVLEEYFFGFDRDTPHDIRSAGKTFASVMLGAAMAKGTKIGPETKVYDLLAGMGPFAHPDPRKAKITLAHLMTHSSGLACDDNDDASPGNEGTMQTQHAQPNWWKYTLDLPMAHDPGTRYAYCSANSNLVGAALTAATHTWLPELFDRSVARPLGFGTYYWNLMPTGEGYQGGGAFVRPRDLLKVGQVYLDGGTWHGKRIVDAAWVKESTAPHIEITPQTTGLDAEQFGNFYNRGVDGYAWHLAAPGAHAYREYDASGNGGQLLIVVPDYDLAVVITAGNYMQGGIWSRWRDEIVGNAIIPAIRR